MQYTEYGKKQKRSKVAQNHQEQNPAVQARLTGYLIPQHGKKRIQRPIYIGHQSSTQGLHGTDTDASALLEGSRFIR